MRICQAHWNGLREEIDLRGLSHLVARSAQEANAIVAEALAGAPEVEFDPLLMANFMILKLALKQFPYFECPLCECSGHGLDAGAWIETAVNAALAEARRLRLVPLLQ